MIPGQVGRMTKSRSSAPRRSSITWVGQQVASGVRTLLDHGYRPDSPAVAPETCEDAAIEIANLRVTYGRRLALDALTGRFETGSLTAIIGPNGAGKSSLLKAVAGIVPCRKGIVRCAAKAAGRLAYLPQQVEVNCGFPVAVSEFVALGGWRTFGAFRRPHDAIAADVATALDAVGLEGLSDRPIAGLSVGEFQRALFARLIMQDAAVILLDEPFAALDEATTGALLGLVRCWHEEGRTVMAVLHDLDQVRDHFPSSLLLARSCVSWGETAAVVTKDNLARARRMLAAPDLE
jgi:zinc/manganese transport system ATP-binding protein